MHTPFAAYLRVYEPLAAFSGDAARYWRAYIDEGRGVAPEAGPAAQRELLYETLGASWSHLPRMPEEAYIAESESGPLICPWEMRERIADTAVAIRESVPAPLADAFIPASFAEVVETEALQEDATRTSEKDRRKHEHIAIWHVPSRWFACVEPHERELELTDNTRLLRYRTPMARARRRAQHAHAILRQALGRGNPVAGSVRQLSEWLDYFHPRSMVEIDYGGLVWALADSELTDDDSVRLVNDGLLALSRGDADAAGHSYEGLMRRWRRIRIRERSN